ncbi:MAG: hypothetical protein RI997_911 [Pseudomonadota bacterium]|jgi:hypothetical protein
MSLSLYQASVPVMLQMLGGLSGICERASAHCTEKKIDPAALLTARLFPNMYMFQKQVQVSTDWARNMASMLAGVDAQKPANDEKTFDDLRTRIATTIAFVKSIDPAKIDAAQGREITWSTSTNTRVMLGEDFALHQALPQFFFHVTCAYAILRSNGVELAKRDFMGDVPRVKVL